MAGGLEMELLNVSHLKKIYTTRFGGTQVQALSDVNFSVEEGEFVAIMGESGSGKTTLLNILATLDKPTAGEVLLSGVDMGSIPEKQLAMYRRNNLGFVFQDFNLLDTFSLKDNIMLPLVLSRKTYSEMAPKMMELSRRLSIEKLLEKYPYEVSGGQIGEKMPKTRWILALLGVVTLAGGYILALKADNVLTGLNTFFVAVLLVIVGTFALFTAGSIAFLKMLQRNKRYYYKTNHFISISGMIYRMKQNAASLSLICIMSTGVLLLISSTTSLYVGQEHSLYLRYPKEFKLSLSLGEVPDDSKTFEKELKEIGTYAEDYLKDNKIATQNAAGQTVIEAAALQKDGNVQITSSRNGSSEDFSDLCMVQAITLEDYNREAKKDETLEDREALVFFEDSPIQQETFSINDMHWKVRQLSADSTMEDSGLKFYVTPVYRIVVKDFAQLQEIWKINKEAYGDHASQVKYEYSFDVDLSEEKIQKLEKSLNAYLGEQKNAPHAFFYGIETRTEGRAEFYSLYGGLFFLGIFLGLLFVMATVLIIYYKQISEGYEDKERFAILKKIGMERGEINASIRSQVLMVFFLPLAAAGIHSCFAFHLVKEILVGGFGLQDVGLLVICAVLTFLAFAVFYVIVYLITAREYYKIVSE